MWTFPDGGSRAGSILLFLPEPSSPGAARCWWRRNRRSCPGGWQARGREAGQRRRGDPVGQHQRPRHGQGRYSDDGDWPAGADGSGVTLARGRRPGRSAAPPRGRQATNFEEHRAARISAVPTLWRRRALPCRSIPLPGNTVMPTPRRRRIGMTPILRRTGGALDARSSTTDQARSRGRFRRGSRFHSELRLQI